MKNTLCEVCGLGCASRALAEAKDVEDDVRRLLVSAVEAASPNETRRWLARAVKRGASTGLVALIRAKCEPLQTTECGRVFHVGCRPADIGECICCGTWIGCREAGPGCPKCGSGRTKSGKPEPEPMSDRRLAQIGERLTGKTPKKPLPDRRGELLEQYRRMIDGELERLDG